MLFSPIPSSVPGPFIARLTKKWILFVDLSGSRARTVHELHKKYGPVVRLAPNELSFASLQAVKPVYGPGTTCIKSSAYDNFGRLGMFQMQDPAQHRERQKRVAHIFAPSSLQQMEPLIQGVVDRLIDVIGQDLGKQVDALHWCRMTALDISGEVLMGKSFGAFDADGAAPTYVHHLDNAYLVWSLFGLAPLLCRALERLPVKSLQDFFAAGDYVYQYGDDALKEYLKLYGRSSKRRSLLTKIIQGDPSTGTEPLSDPEISVEVSNLVFAATDTTGNTMTYALYRLCCHPEWQDKLRAEIRASGAKAANFSFQSLQSLPVLNGIMMETLRLHPAAPSALPRITTGRGCDIGGTWVPGKVGLWRSLPEHISIADISLLDTCLAASLHDPAGPKVLPRAGQLQPKQVDYGKWRDQPWNPRHARDDACLGQGHSHLPGAAHGDDGNQDTLGKDD